MEDLTPTTRGIVAKIWSLCNVLRGDGVSYHQYIAELTYLLFLKVAEETGAEALLPEGYRWNDLTSYSGNNLLGFYQEMLTHLGASAESKVVQDIYAFPTTVFSHSVNLRVVIDGIDGINWHSVSEDGIGQIYEGLLSKNSEDARSGAGQYFTPRALVDCIISVTKPELGDIIQDPSTGTGGFLISADQYIRNYSKSEDYLNNSPIYQGMEIERGTYRICLMNTFLHGMAGKIHLGDALTDDAIVLDPADLILANPPFGSKSGSVRANRGTFTFSSGNKQLEFLQHIYRGLKAGGRAAVVMPDNVLFEDGVARQIRQELMTECDLHTILRLPTGIFYAQGVKTNVLFFSKQPSGTRQVWIYDLRTAMPKFGKRNPLRLSDFSEFMDAYGPDSSGKSRRTDTGVKGRFRAFSREEIADGGDGLDMRWLDGDEDLDSSEGLRPEEISASILANLQIATKEMEDLHALLQTFEAE